MELIDKRADLTVAHKIGYILFSITFLVLPFYYQDNLGGEGMSLPFNAVIWIGVAAMVGLGVMQVIISGEWVRTPYLGLLSLFPLGILLSGFISGMERPSEWIIRLSVIMGGMLFWWSLLQLRLKRRDLENLLYLLLASMLMHAMVGLIQIAPEPLLKGWIPVAPGSKFLGMFQQPNLQASLMATAAVLSLYLASVPNFTGQRWPMKALVLLTLVLSVLEVVGSGSRAGLLGLSMGLGLAALSRIRYWKDNPRWAIALIILIGIGAFAGTNISGGKVVAYSKIERLVEGGRDPRPHIYQIAIDTFERSPIVGHGIGSFQREFQDQRAFYYDPAVGETIDNARFSHPHNELLFWAIEGGSIALAAILAGGLAVLLQLKHIGWQRGGATAALLLPITLHTQVELPFYISTLHWLVLLVLLTLCFHPGSKVKTVNLSPAATRLVGSSALLTIPIAAVFLVNSLLAQTGIMQYLKGRGAQPAHLNFALNNLYFRETGEYFMMRALMYSDIQQGRTDNLQLFVDWAEPFVEQIPDVQIFQDLAIAQQQLGMRDKALNTIERAQSIYPAQQQISELKAKILRGEMLVSSAASRAEKAQ